MGALALIGILAAMIAGVIPVTVDDAWLWVLLGLAVVSGLEGSEG